MTRHKPIRSFVGIATAWWLVPGLFVVGCLAAAFLVGVLQELPPHDTPLVAETARTPAPR